MRCRPASLCSLPPPPALPWDAPARAARQAAAAVHPAAPICVGAAHLIHPLLLGACLCRAPARCLPGLSPPPLCVPSPNCCRSCRRPLRRLRGVVAGLRQPFNRLQQAVPPAGGASCWDGARLVGRQPAAAPRLRQLSFQTFLWSVPAGRAAREAADLLQAAEPQMPAGSKCARRPAGLSCCPEGPP